VGEPVYACQAPADHAPEPGDCDDGDPNVYPGAPEAFHDGIDQDCDGLDPTDVDGDGSPWPADCDDFDPAVHPGQPERCQNGLDDDCNGVIDSDCQYFGGVASAEPYAVIWGERTADDAESHAWAGWQLAVPGDMDGDGTVDVVMDAFEGSASVFSVPGPIAGTMSVADALFSSSIFVNKLEGGDCAGMGVLGLQSYGIVLLYSQVILY
jgi:hypothetical protein